MNLIQPGGTIGILGGGQLGRLLALAARHMGYRIVVFSPEANCPAGQVADQQIEMDYDDEEALRRFASCIDVATIEFENIPVAALEGIASKVPVRPGASVLRMIQNRIAEKTFLSEQGFPVAPFRPIRTESDLSATTTSELPGVLKTASSGYDGKGQRIVDSAEQLAEAWKTFDSVECVLESFVDFECEFSVIVARNATEIVHYQPIRNAHRNHVLDISSSPSGLPDSVSKRAVEVTRGVVEALDYVGILCVEFFLRRDGAIVINEIAPRPHNSGHLTIDAHATSQFEQQVRAVCNLPLGSTTQLRPAAMANLLGDVWSDGTPDWTRALADPDVALHLYGKAEPRVGRKMGHLTCTAETSELAIRNIARARESLQPNSATTDADERAHVRTNSL